jgi:hypothetical protein
MRVDRPFRLPGPEYPTVLRFHSPLIEPDMRICRIRLSDQIFACLRPQRETMDAGKQFDQSVPLVQ